MKCGIFDSGIGGLSVAREVYKSGLFKEIIYFGDTARVPYGNKNESTIIRYSLEILEFLKNFDIDFLIVACNSASAVAVEELKKEAGFPVVGVIEAGVRALKASKEDKILLIGTKRTIASNKYQKLLLKKGYKNIISIPTPLFVPLVEEGIVEGKIIEDVFELYFSNLQKDEIKHIILGCTHYPFLSKSIKTYFKNANLIHSGHAIVNMLKEEYNLSSLYKTDIRFFASDNPDELKKRAKEWVF